MNLDKKNKIQQRIWIEDGFLFYEVESKVEKKISLNSIKLIGEFTTSYGNYIENRFVVFMISFDEKLTIPVSVEGVQNVLEVIGETVDSKLTLTLDNSNEWKSRCIYPLNYQNKEIWKVDVVKPRTLGERFVNLVSKQKPVNLTFTEEVGLLFLNK